MIKKISVFSIVFSLAVLLLSGTLQAQEVANKLEVPVSIPITQIGYPSKIMPGEEGMFVYREYWQEGQGRRFANEYIQAYTIDKFSETWFTPITEPRAPRMKVLDMFRLNSSYVLLGQQYGGPKGKDILVNARFFGLDGRTMGEPVKVSNYDKKAKTGFQEYFAVSAKKKKLMWMGHNPQEAAAKRRYFFTVYSDNGRMDWTKNLTIPHVADDKYRVEQALVDERGNVYMALMYEELTNKEKDTLNLPIILRYDADENKLMEHKLEFPGASVPELQLHINESGELVVMGVLSQVGEDSTGFMNLTKHQGASLRWNQLIYKKFRIERELKLEQEFTLDIPETWMERYGKRGANFKDFRIMEADNQLYWIMEEVYTQIHNKRLQHLYYDVGVIRMDMEEGQIKWATFFEKEQRDYESGELLSFVPGIVGDNLHFVYLNQRGAQGKVVCSTVNLENGEVTEKGLLSNEYARALFFPARSGMVNKNTMMLMGVGHPNEDNYSLISIKFE